MLSCNGESTPVPSNVRGRNVCSILEPWSGDQRRLGSITYSLRTFKWNALQFMEYAAAQKLDAIQFSSLSDFESLETPYLSKVKEAGSKAGLQLDGGVGCVCPSARAWKDNNGTPTEYLMKGLRVSKAIGATAMRCYRRFR